MDPMEDQLCRVCEEKAAGFHFGAFTCEGCKSFFGRFCNNQTNIPDCKNSYRCVVDKRNRTSCKACRLRKCLAVGMSKSGCRYGRRSNWFKIHCLMQKKVKNSASAAQISPSFSAPAFTSLPSPILPASLTSPKLSSSRSPSPLNTSSDSSTSGASPTPESQPPASFRPFNPFSASFSPSFPSPLPLFDPLAFYRLSPLMALHPLLQKSSDFHDQLRLLAERRALFEATCTNQSNLEASLANRSSLEASLAQPSLAIPNLDFARGSLNDDLTPMDLSVK